MAIEAAVTTAGGGAGMLITGNVILGRRNNGIDTLRRRGGQRP